MGENEYGRLWDHLISDEPRKVAEAASSFTSPNHTSTPTTTASGAPSLSRGEKRKKADGESDAHTPSKRGTTLGEILGPLVVEALPTQEPGMFPTEVTKKLLRDSSRLLQSVNSTNLDTHVRIILRSNFALGKVSRVKAKGPKGGKSHKYVRCDSSEHDSDMGVTERVPQSSPDMVLDSSDRVERNDGIDVDGSTVSHQQPSEASHIAQDPQQDLGVESTAESSRLKPSLDASVSQNEQDEARRTLNSTPEARHEKHGYRDIVDKVRATKELFSHHEKLIGEINVLELQQTLARSQYAKLDGQVRTQEVARAGLLAEAQTLRAQAAEVEKKALSHHDDAEKLKEEAENRKRDIEARTVCIARAQEESALNTERMRHSVEEIIGSNLVELLSVRTPGAS
ncbi:hypothetical protein Q7P35_005567 [Cladosporium inversicolor]